MARVWSWVASFNYLQGNIKKCDYKYDIFYSSVLPEISYNFLVIKNNRVFVWNPYLKVNGSSKKMVF